MISHLSDRPCRIAFCITELDPGGAERALVQLVTRLDRDQWEPRVYTLSGPGDLATEIEAAGISVHCLNVRSRHDVAAVGRLGRVLTAFDPLVLQTFLFHANIAGRLAAWRTGVPVVVSGVRVAEQDARWRMRLDRWTNRLVTHNVCVSESVARTYQSLGIAADKLSVIPNGVDSRALASATPANLVELGLPPDARIVLAVGRLHPQKGFDVLLKGVAPLLDADSDLHLVIVGDGPQRSELEQSIRATSEGSRIHLLGRRDDVPRLMQASDLFVLSSRWEGMPNVVLEAMAAGLPIVATDVEGVRELLSDGNCGLIVPPDSPVDLAEGLRKLLADSDLARRLGDAARDRVRTTFTWDAAAARYCALWERLLKERE